LDQLEEPKTMDHREEAHRKALRANFQRIERREWWLWAAAAVITQQTSARLVLTRTFGNLFRSGRFARVEMMQAADFWNLDHMTERGRLGRSADRSDRCVRHLS
jgi:hypothetical protein